MIDEGYVVGHTDFGEADRVVRLLLSSGRVDAVAHHARASRKRFGGALEPGNLVRADVRHGRAELPYLADVEVLHAPMRAHATYDRLVLLAYGCEVVGALAEGHAPDKQLRLLQAWITLLEGDAEPGAASRIALEAKALTFAGLTPALTRCAACDAPLDDPAGFSPEAGGAVHLRCEPGATPVAVDALRAVERLRRTPLAETPGEAVPAPALHLLAAFVEHHARRQVRSRALLDTLTAG